MRASRGNTNEAGKTPGGPAWALFFFVIIAPQLLGGATPGTALAVLALAWLAALWTAISMRGTLRSLGRSPLASLGAALAAGWTLVQILPVPCGWIEDLQPERAQLLAQVWLAQGSNPPMCTLSWAPGSTRVALAQATTLLAVLLASITISRSGSGHRALLVRGLAYSSTLMAVVGLAHTLLKAERIFDWYQPQSRGAPILAPLINTNHLAGHLALGLPLCLAQAMRTRRLDQRMVWIGASFLVLSTGLLTLSRGGAAALVAGGGGYLLLHVLSKRRRRERMVGGRTVATVLPLAIGLGVAAFFTVDPLAKEFGPEDQGGTKFRVMSQLSALVRRYPLLGVGRGALQDASPSVITEKHRILFAENLPLQWFLEWGVPVGLVVLILVFASLMLVRPRHRTDWAPLLGLLALSAQNLVDFSLELPAIACLAAVTLGVVLSKDERSPWIPPVLVPSLRAFCSVGVAVATAAIALATPLLRGTSRNQIRERLITSLDEPTAFGEVLRDGLRAYPLDPTFAVLAATQSVRANARNAGRWLNVSMMLAPDWSAPHIQAAYFLERQGALSQAAIELRLAIEREPSHQVRQHATAFLSRHPSASLAYEILPVRDELRRSVADDVVDGLFMRAPRAEFEAFIQDVLAEFPESAWARRRYVEVALANGDLEVGLQRARDMQRCCSQNALTTSSAIKAFTRAGRPLEALSVFAQAPSGIRSEKVVLMEALVAAGAARSTARVAEVVEELMVRFGATSEERARIHLHASLQFEQAGDLAQALAHAQRSYDLVNDVDALERVHHVAQRAGILQVALRAATEMCHVGHRREAYCQREAPP